jgi:hypothetical protein
MPTATDGEASIHIAAPPNVVYEVVSDITRMGDRSPECYRCVWLDDAPGPEVGARFRGYNRLGILRWATTCVVVTAERGSEFAFTVLSHGGREETQWRYIIEADADGSRLTESYQFLWCPALARMAELPFPRDRQLRRGIRQTLARVQAAAEAVHADQLSGPARR